MAKQQQQTTTKYGGRWVRVLNDDGQKMVFVVEPEHSHYHLNPPIPDQVIPLPDPPSDCDNSAMMLSDGSLTMSCFEDDHDHNPDHDHDPAMDHTNTDHIDHTYNHNPIYYDYMDENADVGDENNGNGNAGQNNDYNNTNNDDHNNNNNYGDGDGDEGEGDDDDTGNNDTDETTTISSMMDDSGCYCHDTRRSTSNNDNDTAMITPDLEEGQQQHLNNTRTVMMRHQIHNTLEYGNTTY